MPLAFERSILTSPPRFTASSSILYEYPDIATDTVHGTCFVGLNYSENPVFLTAFMSTQTPTKKLLQAFSVSTQGTITSGSVLQLTTYTSGYMPFVIAGQSYGAYRYNASSPITATNGGYLYAMCMNSTGTASSVLSALKIKEDTLAITVDASETYNDIKEYSYFLDNLSNQTWTHGSLLKGGEPTYYKRKYTGNAVIEDQKDWWDSANFTISLSGTNIKTRAIGESSENAYIITFGKTNDSTDAMYLQAHQIWTDSTTWSWQNIKSANDLEARANNDLFNRQLYPQIAQISNWKFLCGGTRTADKTKFDYAVAEATFDTNSPYLTNPTWSTSSNESTLDLSSMTVSGNTALPGKLVETNIADTVYAVFPIFRPLIEDAGVWVSGQYDSLYIVEFQITGTTATVTSTNTVTLPFPILESQWNEDFYNLTNHGNKIVFCAGNARFTKVHAVVIKSL